MSNPSLLAANRADPLLFLNSSRYPSSSSPNAGLDADGYLVESSQIGSGSGSFQNDRFLGAGYDTGSNNESEFGYTRSNFRQGPLVGTVELYQRHVFLCYKDPPVWPPRIEAAEFDRLPRLLAAALAARKADMKRETRLTICEGQDGSETSNGDVLIFPDMVRYRRLTHFDVDTFIEEVLVKDGEWLPGSPEALRGWFIFVCCHASRDRRCGVCGPSVLRKFKNEVELCGLQGKVSVRPCSHIGGHMYAGNVIIFGPNMKKEVTGHWYGYVMPEDVPLLLEQHIGKGEIVDKLWRGQMGLSEDDQIKSQELRYKGNGGASISIWPSQVEDTGCCQLNGNSSCCQNQMSQYKLAGSDPTKAAVNLTREKKTKSSKKQISRKNSGIGTGSCQPCSLTWYDTWEWEDTYAALAVVCAAASVAFAIRCYKQLS